MEVKFLELFIAFKFIPDMTNYVELAAEHVTGLLSKHSGELEIVTFFNKRNTIMSYQLRTDMKRLKRSFENAGIDFKFSKNPLAR